MIGRFRHFAAIDWSGAKGERHAGLALAICAPGAAAPELVRPGHRWSRGEILEWLLNDMPTDTLVGLDLGASLPFVDRTAYFPGWDDSPPDARRLWALVDAMCGKNPHLSACDFVDHPQAAEHFRRHGGRKGAQFEGRGRLRVTEQAQRDQGLNPYSNLNLVGAAQVGKSSLTGMRVLNRLAGRIPVWPFDPLRPHGSVVVEIYTSLAAIAAGRAKGRTKIRSYAELDAGLEALDSSPFGGSGPIDDHRSDAILTATWLRANADRAELWHPHALTPEIAATEGWTFGIV